MSKLIVKEPKFWLWVVAKCVRKKLVSWNWCGISDCSVSSICDRDLFSTITFGISNNTITRKRLTFKACIASQNFLIFDYVFHIQDERPSPAAHFFTTYFSNSWKKHLLETSIPITYTNFYFAVSNQEQDMLESFSLRIFCHFSHIFMYKLRTNLYFSKTDCFICKSL